MTKFVSHDVSQTRRSIAIAQVYLDSAIIGVGHAAVTSP